MTRVLLLGLDPDSVDFSDPALPPGMTVEKVHAGIAIAMKQFAEHGWEAEVCLIRPDETAGATVERQLAAGFRAWPELVRLLSNGEAKMPNGEFGLFP